MGSLESSIRSEVRPLRRAHPHPLPAYRETEFRETSTRWTEAQLRGIRPPATVCWYLRLPDRARRRCSPRGVAYLVCDAADYCDVDELLVVTFTEAAAAEMKSRIHLALREKATQTAPNDFDARWR